MTRRDTERRAALAVGWTQETFGDVDISWSRGWARVKPPRYRGHVLELAEWRVNHGEPLDDEMRTAVVEALHRPRHRAPVDYERWTDAYIGAIVEAVACVWRLPFEQSNYGPSPRQMSDEVAEPPRSACAVVASALRPEVGGKAVEAQWRKAVGKARRPVAA